MTLAPVLVTPADLPGWPAADTVILRGRHLRPGTDHAALSRFDDDVWHLQPAHPDAHLTVGSLRWHRYPAALVSTFKAFFLAALDQPYPAGPTAQRPGERAGVGTLPYWFGDLLVFAAWLVDRGIDQLVQITDRDLDAYRTHVLALARTPIRKADLLAVVRTLWLYRHHLPAEAQLTTAYPWPGLAGQDLVPLPHPGWDNKTPRIHPDTMNALLAWALHMVEDIGPDIRDAWTEYQQLERGVHPSQAAYRGTLSQRLPVFLRRVQATGTSLPGKPDGRGGTTVNFGAVLRLVGIPTEKRAGLSDNQKTMIHQSGLPIAEDTNIGVITGRIDGRPWRNRPITVRELPALIRHLYAACFTIVCFLSGMRPGEVLNLPRGCRGTDPETGELLLTGRRGKGFDRSPLAPDIADDTRPWVVVEPVHAAIAMLESLGEYRLLFPASPIYAHASRPNEYNARSAAMIAIDLEDFLAWVNRNFQHPTGTEPIPPDPTKHLHASRFRRTLAYFIVRRPRGLIAAALQFGHVSTKVTMSYAGRADTSWLDDVAVERLEMILEQIDDDSTHLLSGEHVSGPSAQEYRSRIARSARFAGRVVTGVRNVERLLHQADPNIHHGEGMTCVWRAETAACRHAKLEAGLPADDQPDEADCRSACPNLAYTDRNIEEQRARAHHWEAAAADPLAPRPIRDRAAALAARAHAIVQQHERGHDPVLHDAEEPA